MTIAGSSEYKEYANYEITYELQSYFQKPVWCKKCVVLLWILRKHTPAFHQFNQLKPVWAIVDKSIDSNDSYPYPYLFLLKVICIFVLVFFMRYFSNRTHVRKCKEYFFLKRRINPYRKLLVQELKLFGAAQILHGIFPA